MVYIKEEEMNIKVIILSQNNFVKFFQEKNTNWSKAAP